MKFKDLQTKTDDELLKIKGELNQNIMREKALIKIGTSPKNLGKYRQARKTIAKINFIMHDRKLNK